MPVKPTRETRPETAPKLNRWGLLFVMACYLALLSFATQRIHSYVVAQDPHLHYFSQARTIIESDWDPATIKNMSKAIAPGYPLLLAGLMKVWGSYATWVNLMFGLFWVLGLGLLLARATRSALAVALGLGSWFLVLLLQYPLNPHFFLYPFRDGPAQTFMLWALLAVVLPKRPRPLLAGLILLVGMSIREVAVLGFPVVALALLLAPGGHKDDADPPRLSGRWLGLLWLFLPLLLAGGVAIALSFSGNWQVQRMLDSAREFRLDAAPDLFAGLFRGPLWLGVLLAGFGGLGLVRAPRLVLWLVVPAVLVWGLYSFHAFHFRYVMTMLLWLAPLPGLGLWTCLRAVPEPAARRTAFALAVLLFAGALLASSRLAPWGPRVSFAELEDFREAVKFNTKAGDVVIAERGCLLGKAALGSFTHASWNTLDSIRHRERLGKRVFLLEPLTPEAVDHQMRAKVAGVRLIELARATHDLRPLELTTPATVRAGTGPKTTLELGPAHYRLLEVHDRTQKHRRDVLQLTPGWDHWVLLDFRHQPLRQQPGFGHTLKLDSAEQPLRTWSAGSRDGLQFLRIDSAIAKASAMSLIDEASAPGPDPFVAAVVPDGTPFYFDATDMRSLSFLRWFEGDGWQRGTVNDSYGVCLFGEAEVVVPMPLVPLDPAGSDQATVLEASLLAAHVHFEFHTLSAATGCPLEVLFEGQVIGSLPFVGTRKRHVLKVRVPEPSTSEIRLTLRPTDPAAFPFSGLRSVYLSFEMKKEE